VHSLRSWTLGMLWEAKERRQQQKQSQRTKPLWVITSRMPLVIKQKLVWIQDDVSRWFQLLSVHANNFTRTCDSCCLVKSTPLPIGQIKNLLQHFCLVGKSESRRHVQVLSR